MHVWKPYGLVLAVWTLPVLAGCSHYCRRPASPPPGAIVVPGPGTVAPPAFPTPAPFPPGAQPLPPPDPVAAVSVPAPPAQRFFEPPLAVPPAPPAWQPAEGSVHLAPPEAMPAGPPVDTARLLPPEPPAPMPVGPPAPQVAQQRLPASPLPVGIPQFALAKDRVATGLRPLLDDGLDWLAANGYRTVLYVKRPREDDSADRRQVEKRGMRYLTLDVAPRTLSRPVVDEFDRIVGDTSSYPLFVYDRDGSLAGGLWYLYLRTAEGAGDDAARVRAAALGLREDRDDSHREMWLAIQRFLSEQRR